MELMSHWKRMGYDVGMEEGMEKGVEKGKEEVNFLVVHKLLARGFSAEEIAETIELPIDEVHKLSKRS